jgi:hypothetical protein
MRILQRWRRKNIIPAAGRAFVEGASTPSVWLGMLVSVPFAIPTEVAKQMQKEWQK